LQIEQEVVEISPKLEQVELKTEQISFKELIKIQLTQIEQT